MAEDANTLNLKRPRSAPPKNQNSDSGFGERDSSSTNAESEEEVSQANLRAQEHRNTEKEEKEPRIGFGTAFLMVILALFLDSSQVVFGVIGLIPLIGNIIGSLLSFFVGFFAWLSFYTWFKMHNVSFMRPQRLIALLGAGFVELVPYLNALPAWTFAVLFLIANTRIEDKTGINVMVLGGKRDSGIVPKN